MSEDAHAAEIDAHVRKAMVVFGALMGLTVLTVAISYLRLPTPIAITLALIVAITKGSLVALFFMHLISEKGTIYMLLIFTGIFFLALLFLPVFTGLNVIAV